MPIPAPSSSFKPRSQLTGAKDVPSRIQPARRPPATHDDSTDNDVDQDPQEYVKRPSQNRSLSHESDNNGSKRRSFLPQLGQTKSVPRTTGFTDAPEAQMEAGSSLSETTSPSEQPVSTTTAPPVSMQDSRQSRLRPRSMYQTSSASSEQHIQGNSGLQSRSIRPPNPVNKSSGSSSAGLSRSQSLRRPGPPSQATQSTNTRIHSRTQSTSTAMAARKDSTDLKQRSERPKSLLAGPNTLKPSSTGHVDTPTVGTRTSTRLAALKRSTSVKTEVETTDYSKATVSAVTPAETLTHQSRRREPLKEELKKPARPAFSTLQQHFTPRKTGKAPTSTFLHPAPDAGSNTLPPEIISLQSELLQLHLLHEASIRVSRQWELSAKRNLRGRFDEVTSLYQVMRENERQGREQKNLQALRDWNVSNSPSGLVEHIQVLSGPLHELPSLVEPGGRFQRLVDDFDHWASSVEDVRIRRDNIQEAAGLGSIEGLGNSWKAENAALTRKLATFLRDLDRLTQPAPGSSIACIITTCKELLGGILDELQTMQMIEADVVAQEKEWVEARLQAIARDIGTCMVETDEKNAAWRM